MNIIKTKRNIGFDVARAASILFIVGIYHVFNYIPGKYHTYPLSKVLTYSSLCIFTFLSSFLLTSRHTFEDKKSITDFYKKRLLRFYPLFLISSVILYLIHFNGLFCTVKGLLGISPFWKPHPSTMWYCGMLIPLYILTPFWANGNLKKQITKFAIIMSIIIGIQMFFHSVEARTFGYFPVYFLGILIAKYWHDGFLKSLSKYRIILLSLFLLTLILTIVTDHLALKLISSAIGMLALLSLYLYLGERIPKKKAGVISLLSYSSMCIYLFHREVYAVMVKVFHTQNTFLMFAYLALVGVPITILLSYYIQLYYDKLVDYFRN